MSRFEDSSIALLMPTEFPLGSSTTAYRAPQNASSRALWFRYPAAHATDSRGEAY